MLAPRGVERVQLDERRFAIQPLGDARKFVVTKVNQALPFAKAVLAAAPMRRRATRRSARWLASAACVRTARCLQNRKPLRRRGPTPKALGGRRTPARTTTH